VKIVARTQNPLSSQDVFTQMWSGEVSDSNLSSVVMNNERHSWNPPLSRWHKVFVCKWLLLNTIR